MTRERITKLAESFVAEYADPDIDLRAHVDWWADRHHLGASAAAKLREAVTTALRDAHPALLGRRRGATGRVSRAPEGRTPAGLR